ncbi:MAG: response regulator transcription factor [Bacteroidales bacterium]
MKPRILIVDDEVDLLDILAYNLTKNGYEIDTATSGEEALEITKNNKDRYMLILLDVMMGGINGFETAAKLHENGITTPVIFLTALDNETDLLRGFSAGADDYISKPFSIKEVVARVKAVIARSPKKDEIQTIENINIDKTTKNITVDGKSVNLTKTEYMLLTTLAEERGRIFSREELMDRVWGDGCFVEIRTVDVHITRLRKKLSLAGDIIINRSGYGYCIKK